jgi:hypothetical protein
MTVDEQFNTPKGATGELGAGSPAESQPQFGSDLEKRLREIEKLRDAVIRDLKNNFSIWNLIAIEESYEKVIMRFEGYFLDKNDVEEVKAIAKKYKYDLANYTVLIREPGYKIFITFVLELNKKYVEKLFKQFI